AAASPSDAVSIGRAVSAGPFSKLDIPTWCSPIIPRLVETMLGHDSSFKRIYLMRSIREIEVSIWWGWSGEHHRRHKSCGSYHRKDQREGNTDGHGAGNQNHPIALRQGEAKEGAG